MKTLFIVGREKRASSLGDSYDLFLTSPILQSDKSFSKSTDFSPVIIDRV